MNHLIPILPMFFTLILCLANVYSMNSYRISAKRSYLLFALATLVCTAFNGYIILSFGADVFHDLMLYTIAVPYFILFLLVSKAKISQIFFNFWLWVNIYALITNSVMLINDLTFRNSGFVTPLRLILLGVYFVLYNKYLKAHHRRILEIPNVNWWLFSMVPLFFELLIIMTHKVARVPDGFSRSYSLLFVIFALMLLVYAIIFYTFRKANSAMESELARTVYSQQLDAAKAQISFLNEAQMQTAIYRHDMRHNLSTIDAFLAIGNVQQARDYIKEVQDGIASLSLQHFCENHLVNLLCSSFENKARLANIHLTVDADLPRELPISDMELCSILSNGLENAFHAVSELEAPLKWTELYCAVRANKILIEIKNPYVGEILMQDGLPISNRAGHGYGCRCIQSIAKQNSGFSVFEAEHGVFTLRVALPLPDFANDQCTGQQKTKQ